MAASIGSYGTIIQSGNSDQSHLEMKSIPGKKSQFIPSGETYKTHSNAANATYIRLNSHDEHILNEAGFIWTPQWNYYYVHKATGDIMSFSDTGKAEYTNKAEASTKEFDSIPEALTFISLILFKIHGQSHLSIFKTHGLIKIIMKILWKIVILNTLN